MATKVTTMIVNGTNQDLTMKVGNRHYYARLASIKEGDEYKLQVDVNWAYQEFLLQGKTDADNQVFTNSDDCYDYERITIKEISGRFGVERELRNQFHDTLA